MKTAVKVGADLDLEMAAKRFLALNDSTEPERYERELESEQIIEVSLEVAVKIKVDIISVVLDDIDSCYY